MTSSSSYSSNIYNRSSPFDDSFVGRSPSVSFRPVKAVLNEPLSFVFE